MIFYRGFYISVDEDGLFSIENCYTERFYTLDDAENYLDALYEDGHISIMEERDSLDAF